MPEMARVPLVSTNLAAAGYDPETHTLLIEFVGNGRTYAYQDVPSDAFDQLIAAESAGKFFLMNIKGVYAYEEVELPERELPAAEATPTVEERLTKLEAEMKRVLQRMTDDGR